MPRTKRRCRWSANLPTRGPPWACGAEQTLQPRVVGMPDAFGRANFGGTGWDDPRHFRPGLRQGIHVGGVQGRRRLQTFADLRQVVVYPLLESQGPAFREGRSSRGADANSGLKYNFPYKIHRNEY